jgi:hypothetical protein
VRIISELERPLVAAQFGPMLARISVRMFVGSREAPLFAGAWRAGKLLRRGMVACGVITVKIY